MRLWSLHPDYLDRQGLLALWREGLLALAVLRGRTQGYRHHPQLQRFRQAAGPINSLRYYLEIVRQTAQGRGYAFNRRKLGGRIEPAPRSLSVTRGQLVFEREHLLGKLKKRSPGRLAPEKQQTIFKPHPIFRLKNGTVEGWEKGTGVGMTPKSPATKRTAPPAKVHDDG